MLSFCYDCRRYRRIIDITKNNKVVIFLSIWENNKKNSTEKKKKCMQNKKSFVNVYVIETYFKLGKHR